MKNINLYQITNIIEISIIIIHLIIVLMKKMMVEKIILIHAVLDLLFQKIIRIKYLKIQII